jgi:hypothetical protein
MPWSEHLAGCTVTELRSHKPADGVDADQFAAARSAAVALIGSGAVGDRKGQRFNVGLSGHANPDHEQREGGTADGVLVSVSQAEES